MGDLAPAAIAGTLSHIDVPWTRLAGRVLESYERDGLVAFASPWPRLLEEFADQLAGAAGKHDLGGRLGEWLLDRDEIDEVFADDRALARVVLEQARRLAKEAMADETGAPGLADAPPSLDDEPGPPPSERDAWLARWTRRPFAPKTRDGDGPPTASKFRGAALLLPGEAWPVCPGCERPMQLFVQLDLATLPVGSGHPIREGMVQLFYCTTAEPLCEVDHEAWQPYGKSTLARWLSPAQQQQAAAAAATPAPPEALGEPAEIVGWQAQPPELPSYEEDVPPPPDDVDLEDEEHEPRAGDKLGGWPAWLQGPEYPGCRQCHGCMTYLLQLESDGLCRHQFGDVGAGHLFQCPAHPEVVAFGWASH